MTLKVHVDALTPSCPTSHLIRDALVFQNQVVTRLWRREAVERIGMLSTPRGIDAIVDSASRAVNYRLATLSSRSEVGGKDGYMSKGQVLTWARAMLPRRLRDAVHVALSVVNGVNDLVRPSLGYARSPAIKSRTEQVCPYPRYDSKVILAHGQILGTLSEETCGWSSDQRRPSDSLETCSSPRQQWHRHQIRPGIAANIQSVLCPESSTLLGGRLHDRTLHRRARRLSKWNLGQHLAQADA